MLYEVRVKLKGKSEVLNINSTKRVFSTVIDTDNKKTAKFLGIEKLKEKILKLILFKDRPPAIIKENKVIVKEMHRINPDDHKGIVKHIAKNLFFSLNQIIEYNDIINEINLIILTHSGRHYNPIYKESTFIMAVIEPIVRKSLIKKYISHIEYTENKKLKYHFINMESIYNKISKEDYLEDIQIIDNIKNKDNYFLTGRYFENNEIDVIVHRVIKNYLNEKDQKIIENRYGLNNKKKQTFKEISDNLKISRQAIQQRTKRCTNILREHLKPEYEAIQFKEHWEFNRYK